MFSIEKCFFSQFFSQFIYQIIALLYPFAFRIKIGKKLQLINGFISVSPPASDRDFSFLAPCPSSGLIIHGDKDTTSSFDSTKILSEKLQKQKKVNIQFKPIKGADHFYENYSEHFTSIVDTYIKDTLTSLE